MPGFDILSTQVPLEEARMNAILMLNIGFLMELMDREEMKGAQISDSPVPIYDINGELLFYEFEIMKGKKPIGSIVASANKVLGSPIVMFRVIPRRWDYEQIMRDVENSMHSLHGAQIIKEIKFVCYSYPRIGVMINFKEAVGMPDSILLDLPSLNSLSPTKKDGTKRAWSLLDKMVELDPKEATNNFQQTMTAFNTYFADSPSLVSPAINSPGDLIAYCFTHHIPMKFEYVQYCHGHGRSHKCNMLHAQQQDCWCVPASFQMILCFWRYYINQNSLASYLGISDCSQATNFPTLQQQLAIINYLSNQGSCPNCGFSNVPKFRIEEMHTTFGSPTYQQDKLNMVLKIITEINENRPCKIGFVDHAITVFGYVICYMTFATFPTRLFYVLDPWPVQTSQQPGGDIYWQFTDYSCYENAIMIKRI